jgi:uncharacterized membrane protein YvbJ
MLDKKTIEQGDDQSEQPMTCCRECKALNSQDSLFCLYCGASMPIVAPLGIKSLPDFNLTSQTKRRLLYVAIAIIVLVLVRMAS